MPGADETVCDSCRQVVKPDINGYWVGPDDTSECDQNSDGHTVDGDISA